MRKPLPLLSVAGILAQGREVNVIYRKRKNKLSTRRKRDAKRRIKRAMQKASRKVNR